MITDQELLKDILEKFELFENVHQDKNYGVIIIDKDFIIKTFSNSIITKFYNKNDTSSVPIKNGLSILNVYSNKITQNQFYNIIEKVKQERVSISAVGFNIDRNPEYYMMYFNYCPIINPDTGNVIGVKLIGSKLVSGIYISNLIIEVLDSHKNAILAPLIIPKSRGNIREQEILFLLCHFHTIEMITLLLNYNYQTSHITPGGVSKFITRNLYPKYNVDDLICLKNLAFNLDFHKIPPESLVNLMSSIHYEL